MDCTLDQYPPVFICGRALNERTPWGFNRTQARLGALTALAWPAGLTPVTYTLVADLTETYGPDNFETELPSRMASVLNLLHLTARNNGELWVLASDDKMLNPETEMCVKTWRTHYSSDRIHIANWNGWKPTFEYCDQRETWELLC
jgi:hypothetical protein